MEPKEFIEIIIKRINADELNEDIIKRKLNEIKSFAKTTIFKNVLNLFTHLNMNNKMAQEHWNEIFKRQDELTEKLGYPVPLLTVITEHFFSLNKKIKKPFVVEVDVMEKPISMKIKDDITGVYNKEYGYDLMNKEVIRAGRYDNSLSIIALDIDNFTELNEKYSHEFGDKVLSYTADLIKNCIRSIDFIYRNDSDQFIVVLPETPALGALEVSNRIRKKLMSEYILPKDGDNPVAITVSGGISSFKVDSETTNELLDFALDAMNSAIKDGGSKIYLYFQEKRKFLRLDAFCKVGYKIMEEGGQKTTFSKNLSAGGVLFETDHFVNLNTFLEVTIQIPDIDWIITALGKVVRIEQLPNSKYDLGIYFTEIDPEDQNTILKYIQNKINPKFNIY
ncbi:MAG: diguanylate cyclase [bacterium]|nr:diguanylate cyclase [bacterium]